MTRRVVDRKKEKTILKATWKISDKNEASRIDHVLTTTISKFSKKSKNLSRISDLLEPFSGRSKSKVLESGEKKVWSPHF